MILCIDSGNTRLKWGWHDGAGWTSQGAVSQAEIAGLAEALPGNEAPSRIMVANVAGPAAEAAIRAAVAFFAAPTTFVRAAGEAAGVTNGYDLPAQLGVDRWCALVGARGITRNAAVVVGLGTATTVDTLDESGRFLGGLILPGFDLMRASLARNTAQLPLATGTWTAYPHCTDDAIATGCLEAQLGTIERAFARIAARPEAQCLLFGGRASTLAPRLTCPYRLVDNLVLEGLRRLAEHDPA